MTAAWPQVGSLVLKSVVDLERIPWTELFCLGLFGLKIYIEHSKELLFIWVICIYLSYSNQKVADFSGIY